MQTAGDLHHPIRNALFGQAQDILDNPTALNARNGVLDHDAHAGKEPIEQSFPQAQLLALGLFFGWVVNTPTGE